MQTCVRSKCFVNIARGGEGQNAKKRKFPTLVTKVVGVELGNHGKFTISTGPEGNTEFCFPVEIQGKRNSLFPKGPVSFSSYFSNIANS